LEAEQQKDLLSAAKVTLVQERDTAEAARTRAENAERATRTEADKVRAVNRFYIDDLLGEVDPDKNERQKAITVEEVLDRAAGKLDPAFAGLPEIEVELRATVGRLYQALGAADKSEVHLRRAALLYHELLGPEDLQTRSTQRRLVWALEQQQKFAQAEKL